MGGGASGAEVRLTECVNGMLTALAVVEPPDKVVSALVSATVTAQDVRAWQHTGTDGADRCSECCWWCPVGTGVFPVASCPGAQRDSLAANPRCRINAVALNATALGLLVLHRRTGALRFLNVACACAFAGVWIEKGMGLIVPGFVPSTLHELVEYAPSLTEWKVTAGVWAFGFGVLTVGLKIALPVLSGRPRLRDEAP